MATCKDGEGWDIRSTLRPFDTTPCFEEGIAFSTLHAVLTLTAIVASLTLCLREARELSAKSRWLLYTKMTFLVLALGVSITNVALIWTREDTVPIIQSYIFEPIAILGALCLTYYNHTRKRKPSTALLVYWPLYAFVVAIWIRTYVTKGFYVKYILALKCASLGLGLVSYCLECVGVEVGMEMAEFEHPSITANIYSIWTFSWMTELMKKGASQFIAETDLPSLRPHDEAYRLGNRLQDALKKHSLRRALFVAYGKPYAYAAFLKVIQDLLAFAQPQLLRLLLAYISAYQASKSRPTLGLLFWGQEETFTDAAYQHTPFMVHETGKSPHPLEGFAIAFLMFLAGTSQTIILNQYFQLVFETGMRVRGGLVSVIYEKALILSNDERSGRSSGDIVNYMSVDAMRLQDFCQFGLISISGPFQITLAFISLYKLLGWPAFVGVAVMVVSIPLNAFIARILKKMQEKQMKNRDKRTRLMSELLSNIKSIKLYAWEFAFVRRVLEVRNEQELKMLKKIGITTSISQTIWGGVPLLVAFSSFAVAAITGEKPLTSDVIFPAISLFMLLGFPLAMFSMVISNLVEATVSTRRLSEFLNSEEAQADARVVLEAKDLKTGEEVLNISNADFTWSQEALNPTLENVNLKVKKGELVGVLGKVGSGKTSLLSAIIGEMTRKEGQVVVRGRVAYCPQNPWIMSASVRDNILFSLEYDEIYYNAVIEACALTQDLALLSQGDLTEVGEKGITLSGGQRARVALARAVYARADLVLLDDVLAAVDSHVAKHIFTHVIGPNGLLASRARILVTNSIAFVKEFDQIAFLRRGIILEAGSYDSLMANNEGEIRRLMQVLSKLASSHVTKLYASDGHGTTASSSGTSTPFTTRSGTVTPEESEGTVIDEKSSGSFTEKLSRLACPPPKLAAPPPTRAAASTGLSKEHQEQGQVKRTVYMEYIKAASKTGFAFFLISIIAQQALSVLSNLVLRSWGEANQRSGENTGVGKYLIYYGLISLASALAGGLSAVILWVYCSLRSAKKLHDSMLDSLIRAPLSFFELTPTGRVLNLFSRDIYVVDQVLARVISAAVRTTATSLFIVIVIGSSFPLFLLAVIPLGWFYLRVMKYYLATSRELKRLDAVSRSPIFAWFSESIAGLSTIRAFGHQDVFQATNRRNVDRNQICYLSSVSVNRWLSVRLEIVGAIVIFVVATLAIIALITTGVDAGLVGLVLSYALNATSSLNWVVRSASEVEQNIVSVERILHQVGQEPEAPLELTDSKSPEIWPSEGAIEFKGYSTRYRPELEPVLRELSMSIKPKEKIGICGRTGAGKSSLLLALFRIIEPTEGTILIDGVDITKIGLHDLRSSISIVPQSPDLFEGTLRENIDPVGEHQDADIWVAITQAHLREYVETLPESLDTLVREGGSSLSSGQRQLLCFARALLRKSKILVLDEATSAVDLDTDRNIQEIIRGPAFKDVTILTIAHRLNTIIESDRVLVMDQGKMAEFDTPKELLANADSIFYSLVKEAGLGDTN